MGCCPIASTRVGSKPGNGSSSVKYRNQKHQGNGRMDELNDEESKYRSETKIPQRYPFTDLGLQLNDECFPGNKFDEKLAKVMRLNDKLFYLC